jgi:hypothetical protein
MKKILVVCFVIVLIVSFSCTNPQQDGWKNITPVKDLSGWTIVDVPKDGPLPETPQWFIDKNSGNLVCQGDKGLDWLRYDVQQYSDFIFHVEWRFEKIAGKPKYNSGVYIRNSADRNVWHQAQTGDAAGGYIFGNTLADGEQQRVSTRDQMDNRDNPVNPAGEWNIYEITCKGSVISLTVNNIKTTTWENCKVEKGFLGLEAEGYFIEFRNIKVKEL